MKSKKKRATNYANFIMLKSKEISLLKGVFITQDNLSVNTLKKSIENSPSFFVTNSNKSLKPFFIKKKIQP